MGNKPAKKGQTPYAKSHKSRKAEPKQSSVSDSPSSVALVTTPLSPTPPVDLALQGVEDKPTDADRPRTLTTGVPDEDPKKQWWYRPADSKVRKKADKIAVLRAAGHKSDEIAKRLHTTEGTVRQIVYLANKNGWYRDVDGEDEPVDIEAELAMSIDRKIVRNIGASLDGEMTNWQTHEMTIAAAKGRGHFKNHEKSEGGTQAPSLVAIKIIMPVVSEADQKIIEENVGGVPAFAEGEVVEVSPPLLPSA